MLQLNKLHYTFSLMAISGFQTNFQTNNWHLVQDNLSF